MNDVSFDRPTNFAHPANPNGITFDEFDVVDPYNFQPGVLADITTAPFLPDNMSEVSQFAVFGEAQFNLGDRFAIVGALRMDDYDTQIVRLGRAGIDQQVDDVTGRIGLVFDLSDDTALYGQYGTGSTHPSSSIVTGAVNNRFADMIESEQLEIGLKHQVDGTGFQWSVALFDITKNNLIYDNPSSGNPADVITVPEQTSQGVEVGFSFTATESFQFYGNASTLSSETAYGCARTVLHPGADGQPRLRLGYRRQRSYHHGRSLRRRSVRRHYDPGVHGGGRIRTFQPRRQLRAHVEGRQHLRRAVRDVELLRRNVAGRQAAHGERRVRFQFLGLH